ncbi:ABC transporter permease [Haloechinothrix aidingensis]|uniref:ABC transporter permease n=1 Tax=Haloechinothrix aidingensis TaxID=2752311 RepID=UPI0031B5B663
MRHPRGYWGAVAEDMHRTIKQAWLPLTVAIAAFTVFTAMVAMMFFAMVGGQQLFGPMMYLQSVRTFTVWVNAIAVAGIVGAALTADIGSRKVREELDAMEVMGVDPVRDLAVPRVISLTLITVILSIPSILITTVAMQWSADYVAHLPTGAFYSNLFVNLTTTDLIGLLVNSALIGLLIATVCCYKGFNAGGGAIGLGRAVNQAVVASVVGVFVLQLPYQAIFLGLFPEVGAWK